MTPRPYQSQCIDAVSAGWKEFRKQLAVLPTGAGKTIIFSFLAARNSGNTLILAHREELIQQAWDKLRSATGIVAGIEKAADRASLNTRVVIASVQTLMNESRRQRWPHDHFDLLVVDEAHHALADSYRRTLEHFSAAKVLGVTATPDRGDKKNLGTYFQNVAFEISLLDLIKDGYLSPITVKAVPLRIDLNDVECTAGDFRGEDLGNAIEPYLGQIVQAIKDHAPFRRVLAFLPLIATSQKFVAACNEAGLRAVHVDGQSSDRKEILDRYAAGEFDILSNAMLLTEGFDVDAGPTGVGIDCILVLRPTRSRPLFAQMVGRGTRIAPLKDNLLLLDLLWLHKKHRICRPASLIAKSDEEADAITAVVDETAGLPGEIIEQLDLLEVAASASTAREEALRKKLAEAAKNKATFISAEEFAIKHNSLAVAEYEPTMPWEFEPATDKQKWVLKRAKIDPATVKGKGHASKLIGLHYQTPVDATPRQKGLLRRMGYEHWNTATAREAQQVFAKMKKATV